TMEQKKKVWPNLRERAKPNLILKIGTKGLGKKKKTPLIYRKSMSVPDLRINPSAMLDLQDDSRTPGQDSVFFGNMEGSCDLDEAASETASTALSEQLSPNLLLSTCQFPAGLNDSQSASAQQKFQYLLTINLKEGKNLVIRDRSGTSDPFVKFKLDGKNIYKSKVVNKNLNPTWNESFSFPVRDLDQTLHLKVFILAISSKPHLSEPSIICYLGNIFKSPEFVATMLNTQKTDKFANCKNMFRINKHWPKLVHCCMCWLFQGQLISPVQVMQLTFGQRNQVWTGIYTVILVEGQDMPDCGQGDVYIRFRVVTCLSTDEILIGSSLLRLDIDLIRLPVNQKQLYTHELDPNKGRLVFLVTLTPCSGASISDIQSAPLDNPTTFEEMQEKYGLMNSLRDLKDIGYLQIKLIKATDLPSTDLSGKRDPFCTLELGNSKLQTHTISKTLNPEWRTALTFPIKDIHDVLVLTVYHDDGDKAPDVLGKVAIPLLTVSNGQQITRTLKNNNLSRTTKGSITLELNVLYNHIRAGVKTFRPKEIKFAEDNPKFNKKLLARNIYRVRKISMAILYTLQYIKSCFHWENMQRSITAFLIFVVTVWLWELFMLPLFLLLLIGWNYFHITPGMASYSQDLVTDFPHQSLSFFLSLQESEKKGLMEKIHMVQEIVFTVQNTLDEVACIGERVKNTFNWAVPFLSFLACLVLFLATAALYYIPLRCIVLVWGVNKFTKKLFNPYAIDNNEILDFLKRVPSDVQKVQYSEPRAELGNQGPAKKKRLR
uniref:Multiple C2 and transmembrane domain-containing protein 2-like n=1 Tax=Sinocyclocheilus grahami TaxID=75366 RepID=A0A672NJS9_SINGR